MRTLDDRGGHSNQQYMRPTTELIKDPNTKQIFKDKYSQAIVDLKALEVWHKEVRKTLPDDVDELSYTLVEDEYKARKTELTKRKAKFHRYLMVNTDSYTPPAGHLSDADIDELKQIPIVDLVDLSVARSTGNRTVAICPFHNESSASFTIYHDSNSAHCFGCSYSGDNIDVVMKFHSVGFKEAIKLIQGG